VVWGTTYAVHSARTHKYLACNAQANILIRSAEPRSLSRWTATELDDAKWTLRTDDGLHLGIIVQNSEDALLTVRQEMFVWQTEMDDENVRLRVPGADSFVTCGVNGNGEYRRPEPWNDRARTVVALHPCCRVIPGIV